MRKKLLTIFCLAILIIAVSFNIQYSVDIHRMSSFNKTSLYSIALAEDEGGSTARCYTLCCKGTAFYPYGTYECSIWCSPEIICWSTGTGMFCDYTIVSCSESCPPEHCDCDPSND